MQKVSFEICNLKFKIRRQPQKLEVKQTDYPVWAEIILHCWSRIFWNPSMRPLNFLCWS